jgi:hypothetical protein
MITPGQKTYKDIGFDNFGTRIAVRPVQVHANQMDAFYELAQKQIMEKNLRDAIVSATKIAASAVSESKIAASAVSESKIAENAVTTPKIADAQITNAKINDLSADKITAGTLTADRIASGSISDAKLGITVISGGKIVTSLLTADNIQAGTLVGRTVESNSDGYRIILDASNRRIGILDGSTLKGRIFCDGDGDLKIYSQDDIVFNVPTGYQYRFRINDALQQFLDADGDWNPRANHTQKVGTLGYAYSQMNSYDFNDHCLWLDEEDDLAILRGCAPKKDKDGSIVRNKDGKPELDPQSLPEWMNTERDLREENKTKKMKLTEDEIQDRVGRNLGHFVDLLAGSVRKLADRLDSIEQKIVQLDKS